MDIDHESIPDAVLVQGAKNGDERAMDRLVVRHHGAVFRTALAILREEELARDVAQDTFIKALNALGRFRGDSAFRTWVLAIAANEARGALRKLGRRRETSLDEAPPLQGTGVDPALGIERKLEADRVRREIDKLPEKQRLAVSLRIFDGLSFREVGEVIDSSEGAARVNYHHGIRRLKEKLRDV
jgi:RNA polymerase sigma-70 factor (ECF subfamily)